MADRAVVGAIPSEGLVLEYQSGANWITIPGIVDYAESGGAAPTRDVVPISGGVGKRVGRARVPTVTFNAFQLPTHPAWAAMRAAKVDETTLTFRITTQEQVLFVGGAGRAAIATTGAVTLSVGPYPSIDGNAIGPGDVLVIGSTPYTVSAIDDSKAVSAAGFITVSPAPASAVAAAAYKISIPGVRRGPFSSRVIDTDQWSIAAESELQAALVLQPFGQLPVGTAQVSAV